MSLKNLGAPQQNLGAYAPGKVEPWMQTVFDFATCIPLDEQEAHSSKGQLAPLAISRFFDKTQCYP